MIKCSSQRGTFSKPVYAHQNRTLHVYFMHQHAEAARRSKALVLIPCLHAATLNSDFYGLVHQNTASIIDCEHNSFLTFLNSV